MSYVAAEEEALSLHGGHTQLKRALGIRCRQIAMQKRRRSLATRRMEDIETVHERRGSRSKRADKEMLKSASDNARPAILLEKGTEVMRKGSDYKVCAAIERLALGQTHARTHARDPRRTSVARVA